jgi:hypothetical protein
MIHGFRFGPNGGLASSHVGEFLLPHIYSVAFMVRYLFTDTKAAVVYGSTRSIDETTGEEKYQCNSNEGLFMEHQYYSFYNTAGKLVAKATKPIERGVDHQVVITAAHEAFSLYLNGEKVMSWNVEDKLPWQPENLMFFRGCQPSNSVLGVVTSLQYYDHTLEEEEVVTLPRIRELECPNDCR